MDPVEQKMTSWDGAELFYRAWIPQKKNTQKRRYSYSIVVTSIRVDGRKRSNR